MLITLLTENTLWEDKSEIMENSMGILIKLKLELPYDLAHSPGHISRETII